MTVEYHWLEGHYDRLPALLADLIRRKVAVIATPGNVPSIAAKAATATIPIVFGAGEDAVRLGLVASLNRPDGNATGINFFGGEAVTKQLGLLHELMPKAVRVAVLVNPANTKTAEFYLREIQEAAPPLGLQIQTLNASTIGEIDAAFAMLARERPDALFVTGDAFFVSSRGQLVILTAHDRIPATYSNRDFVAAGGLMSYGTDLADMFRQVGVFTQPRSQTDAAAPRSDVRSSPDCVAKLKCNCQRGLSASVAAVRSPLWRMKVLRRRCTGTKCLTQGLH